MEYIRLVFSTYQKVGGLIHGSFDLHVEALLIMQMNPDDFFLTVCHP